MIKNEAKPLFYENQKGQAFILGLIVFTLITINTVFIISRASNFSQNAFYTVEELQAINLAEAAIDKTVASINKNPNFVREDETFLGNGSYSIAITPKDISTNIITATGYIPNKTNPKVKRSVKIEMTKGIGASFTYGLQVDQGGIEMENNAVLNGSVYSNGNIKGKNNDIFNGDVWVAGGIQPLADQEANCQNCSDLFFGKNVAGNSQYDIAQSFQPSCKDPPTCTPQTINKVSLKLKKIGNPQNLPNLTLRIVSDDSGKPSKIVLAQGTLYSVLVTTSYGGFIDVTLSTTPTLSADTPYWIVVDTCGNSTNSCDNYLDYWAWSADLSKGYNRGVARWSPHWQAGNPSWSSASPDVDLDFQVYMGGVVTSVEMDNGSRVNGDVKANTLKGTFTVSNDAYYSAKDSAVTVEGTSYTGASYPGDPPPQVFPISQSNIDKWISDANAGVQYNDISGCNMSLGPGKVSGNLNITGTGCTVTVKTPLWVTRNITALNQDVFKLDSSLGSSSGLIMVDGIVTSGNGIDLLGSGEPGSYLMLLSTYDSRTSRIPAFETGNSLISGIIYAPLGIVSLPNGGTFREIAAWKIEFGVGAILNYDIGLSSIVFSSGPTGSFTLIKGTYQTL